MSEAHELIYRNRRWNTRIAFYAAAQGAAFFGAPPALVAWLLFADSPGAAALMLACLVAGAAVPMLRALTGHVSLDGETVVVRNPFRTHSVSLAAVNGFGDVPLRQGFHVVAALQVADPDLRVYKVVPVPGQDGPLLERLLTVRSDDLTPPANPPPRGDRT